MKLFPDKVVIVLSEDVHLTEDVPGLVAVHHHHLVSPRVGTLTPKLRGVAVVFLHCDLWKMYLLLFFLKCIYIKTCFLSFFYIFKINSYLTIDEYHIFNAFSIFWIHKHIFNFQGEELRNYNRKNSVIRTVFSKILIVFTSLFLNYKILYYKRKWLPNFLISAENFPNQKKKKKR